MFYYVLIVGCLKKVKFLLSMLHLTKFSAKKLISFCAKKFIEFFVKVLRRTDF